MQVDVKVPPLSESIAEAVLSNWRKKAGDSVKRDELLVELETDKVVLEVTAPEDGLLTHINKEDGASVVANETIATINTEKNLTSKPKDAAYESSISQQPSPHSAAASLNKAETLSPAVRKLVAEHVIDPEKIAATGKGGRITKADVLQHLQSEPAPEPLRQEQRLPVSPSGDRADRRVPISRLRARIAERLKEAQNTAAILTTFNEVNMQPVMELRNRYKDRFEKEYGVKLGFMSFFTKAVVEALQKFPIINASLEKDAILYHDYCDIGIAVSSPRGLVVPILRNAENLSFVDIEKTVADFGHRAREGKLAIEELTGGTFSISNGGVFGSLLSTPILNPPQSAILGMHKIQERPIAENGQIIIRPMMYLALSYDHRLIDGREAVSFLVNIKDMLEEPARMLLKI